MRQDIGVLYKETGFGKVGRWQLINWRPRFAYATRT
eukprot:CAMPEP_0183366382 /NCGR_PEP_ID=MMETSP0164_2-20130417/88436_1 /TAXON_ID=221442 /ORGANISM="Coccolithus pelagicus ssp braarudi, Strain PLY182g" /LENGTH=35 /DNA_ID= /DNA_START= /DNA_END= /DNA_ORIENTATION=